LSWSSWPARSKSLAIHPCLFRAHFIGAGARSLHFGLRFQDRVPRLVTQSSKWPGVSWNGMTSAIFVRQKRWWNCFRICRRLPGTRANCRQGSNTRWSTSVTNFRVIRFPRAKRWIRFFGNARRRVFRTVTVRNETRSYLNEPKAGATGIGDVVYRLSGAEKGNFEPPDARIRSPVFSNSYKFALLNRIVKLGGQKPKNK
jgi:hypothetical protein